MLDDPPDSGTLAEPSVFASTMGDALAERSGPTREQAPAPQQGAMLGRYLVLSKLGAGAMGEVFAAYDPELDRKVALKLLKPHVANTEAARTRLRREAQALARLGHPNVVAVYDVGQHQGQLFVGMEFVEGQTLGSWLSASDQPRAWREILPVFLAAGRGLAAAHAADLIHRDFKPDNVMLGTDGRVRVMDFGLARSVNDPGELGQPIPQPDFNELLASPLTQTGAVLGTPAYMSLEQFTGTAADARSDQFGFCVALYEALYGARPFAATTVAELMAELRAHRIQPAPRGSSVPAWLRQTLARGLSPDPDARWPSMDALLSTLSEAPRRRARRRGLAAALGLLGLVGGALAGYQHIEAQRCAAAASRLDQTWNPGSREQLRASLLGVGPDYAADTWLRVEQGLDEWSARWVQARTQLCELDERSPEARARAQCLESHARSFTNLVEILGEAERSVLSHALDATAGLPQPERCARARPVEASGALDGERARVQAELERINVLMLAGRDEEALELGRALEASTQALDDEALLAEIRLRRGELELETGVLAQVEGPLRAAFSLATQQQRPDLQVSAARGLAELYRRFARWELSGTWSEIALAHLDHIDHPQLAESELRLVIARALFDQGRSAESITQLDQALSLARAVHGEGHPALAAILLQVIAVELRAGRYPAARANIQEAQWIYTSAFGPEHPGLARVQIANAQRAYALGEFEPARDELKLALGTLERALGTQHPDFALGLRHLALVERQLNHFERALELQRQALAIIEALVPADHPALAAELTALGEILYYAGRYFEAQPHFERSLAINVAVLGPLHPANAPVYNILGHIEVRRGNNEEALVHYRRSKEIYERTPGQLGLDVEAFNEAVVLRLLGRPEQALARIRDSLRLFERREQDNPPQRALALYRLGQFEAEAGQTAAGLAHMREGLELRVASVGTQDRRRAEIACTMVEFELELGHVDEASALLEMARPLLLDPDIGQASLRADCLFAEARLRWALGEKEAALEFADQAQAQLELAEDVGTVEWIQGRLQAWRRARQAEWEGE